MFYHTFILNTLEQNSMNKILSQHVIFIRTIPCLDFRHFDKECKILDKIYKNIHTCIRKHTYWVLEEVQL